jgi:hypothetical protein
VDFNNPYVQISHDVLAIHTDYSIHVFLTALDYYINYFEIEY